MPPSLPEAPVDLDAYLARIAYAGDLAPTAATLSALYRAHVEQVPFENLDVLLGCPIRLDLPALEDKLVRRRRGGYCFEHATLFAAVLAELGFACTPLAARVRFTAAPGTVNARTHMLLLVETPEGPYLADPGFGGHGPRLALPLVEGQVVRTEHEAHRLRREPDGTWVLEAELGEGFRDLHAFTLEPQVPADYEVASWYTSTHPRSIFTRTLMLQRLTPTGRVTLRDRELARWRGREVEREPLADRAALVRVLKEAFGLDVPEAATLRVPAVPEWAA